MKFGKKLGEVTHPAWAGQYVCYKTLKQILKQIGTDPFANAKVEGHFLTELMTSINQVNEFYLEKEAELARVLKELATVLAKPEAWVTQPLKMVLEDVTLATLVPLLSPGTHAPAACVEALQNFVSLCGEVDSLRKFSVLNYLAVTKIVKKHDKLSTLSLREGIMNFVGEQSFYTSTVLATTFTHAQCIASEVVAAATGTPVIAQSEDYSCCICFEVLNMPVILSCAHRFCYGCLARACFYGHHCPLCKKETDLDPANYRIDPILTKFVDAHLTNGKPPKGALTADGKGAAAATGKSPCPPCCGSCEPCEAPSGECKPELTRGCGAVAPESNPGVADSSTSQPRHLERSCSVPTPAALPREPLRSASMPASAHETSTPGAAPALAPAANVLQLARARAPFPESFVFGSTSASSIFSGSQQAASPNPLLESMFSSGIARERLLPLMAGVTGSVADSNTFRFVAGANPAGLQPLLPPSAAPPFSNPAQFQADQLSMLRSLGIAAPSGVAVSWPPNRLPGAASGQSGAVEELVDSPSTSDATLPPSKMARSSSPTAGTMGKTVKKRACFECHRAKAACEGDPCWRCVRLGKKCVTLERQRRRRRSANSSDSAGVNVGDMDFELEDDALPPLAPVGEGAESATPMPVPRSLSVSSQSTTAAAPEALAAAPTSSALPGMAGGDDMDLLFSLSTNELSALIA